jgi:hypothetical protein
MKKLLLSLGIFCTSILSFNYLNAIEINKSKVVLTDSTCNEHNIITVMFMLGVKFPEVVLSQIMIESGNLKHFKNNNLLGLTVPSKRKTTALNKSGYAIYANWIDCILDYKLYQDARMQNTVIKTSLAYIKYLRKWKYAEADDYSFKLKNKYKTYELEIKLQAIDTLI